jgi:hypothetical protein
MRPDPTLCDETDRMLECIACENIRPCRRIAASLAIPPFLWN